jgi:hypothetical protein
LLLRGIEVRARSYYISRTSRRLLDGQMTHLAGYEGIGFEEGALCDHHQRVLAGNVFALHLISVQYSTVQRKTVRITNQIQGGYCLGARTTKLVLRALSIVRAAIPGGNCVVSVLLIHHHLHLTRNIAFAKGVALQDD